MTSMTTSATPPLSLDKIAELTYGRLPLYRQFGLDNWKCHLFRNKHDIIVIVNAKNVFRGMVIAYMITDTKLFVNWCICEDGATFDDFVGMLRNKFPLAQQLVYDRRGQMKTLNVHRFIKHKSYGK